MISFRQAVFNILGKGQELTAYEEALIGEEVRRFTDDYKLATGGEPLPLFETFALMANRLRLLGFEMPRADRWMEEICALERESERPRIRYARGERF